MLVVFIDYSKAFDTMRHSTLIEKLDNSGVRGSLRRWCEDYLRERSYCVRIGSACSDAVSVTEGTAQGSVLGPIHYLTYVNDINNVIEKCTVFQFADDTCLISDDLNAATALVF